MRKISYPGFPNVWYRQRNAIYAWQFQVWSARREAELWRDGVWEMETNYRVGSIRMECQHTAASPSTSAPEKLNCQIGGGRAGQEKIQIRSGRWFVRELAFHCSAKWKSIFIVTRDNDPLEKWREVFEHILTAWCLAFSHFTLSSRHTSTNQIWPHLHALMLRSG